MNKYALGTIVWAALLGLAKRQSGSTLRLTTKETEKMQGGVYLYFVNVDTDYNDHIQWIQEEINEFSNQYPRYNFLVLTGEDDYEINDEEWGTQYQLTVEIKLKIEFEPGPPTFREDSLEIAEDLENFLATRGVPHNDSSIEDNYWTETTKIVVNADTGEEYKIAKKKVPKLRAR